MVCAIDADWHLKLVAFPSYRHRILLSNRCITDYELDALRSIPVDRLLASLDPPPTHNQHHHPIEQHQHPHPQPTSKHCLAVKQTKSTTRDTWQKEYAYNECITWSVRRTHSHTHTKHIWLYSMSISINSPWRHHKIWTAAGDVRLVAHSFRNLCWSLKPKKKKLRAQKSECTHARTHVMCTWSGEKRGNIEAEKNTDLSDLVAHIVVNVASSSICRQTPYCGTCACRVPDHVDIHNPPPLVCHFLFPSRTGLLGSFFFADARRSKQQQQ